MKKFSEFNLSSALIENLESIGFITPTEIQGMAIPKIQEGRDILGIAKTGTGKTAAFGLPILDKLISKTGNRSGHRTFALILVPTRELCSQIVENIDLFSKGLSIKSCALYGGVPQTEQVNSLKSGVDIIVATPGRLLDLMGQGFARLQTIEFFVLDEADRMLDMGFIDDIKKIVESLPLQKQTLFFSATMPNSLKKLVSGLLVDPTHIQASPPSSVQELVSQKIIFCHSDHKFQLLKKLIKDEPGRYLVFTTSKLKADHVVEYLRMNRISTGSVHADKKQTERERHLDNFKSGAIKILVATDIAARGIDIDGITHVINFDLPLNGETYVHRIGRTGRSGNTGESISFCDESELTLLDKIKRVVKTEIPSEKFVGKKEVLNLDLAIERRKRTPTPGKSQEKTAYLDHSKRQAPLVEGQKARVHPGFKKTKKRR